MSTHGLVPFPMRLIKKSKAPKPIAFPVEHFGLSTASRGGGAVRWSTLTRAGGAMPSVCQLMEEGMIISVRDEVLFPVNPSKVTVVLMKELSTFLRHVTMEFSRHSFT